MCAVVRLFVGQVSCTHKNICVIRVQQRPPVSLSQRTVSPFPSFLYFTNYLQARRPDYAVTLLFLQLLCKRSRAPNTQQTIIFFVMNNEKIVLLNSNHFSLVIFNYTGSKKKSVSNSQKIKIHEHGTVISLRCKCTWRQYSRCVESYVRPFWFDSRIRQLFNFI